MTDFVMADVNDVKYFEDPVLTFDNSIVYGCHLDLDYDELEEFCKTGYKNLMIF